MNKKQNFIGRRKWLTMSGMGSLGAFFLGMVNPRQIKNNRDVTNPDGYIFKQPTKKSGRVSVVKGEDHYTIVYKSLKNIEDEIIKSIGDKKILIKPNMVVANRPACATDPIAVKAILDFLKPHYKKQIIIGESTAAYENVTTLDLFKQYGYSFLADDYNVKFLDLNATEYEYRYIWGVDNKPCFIRVNKPFLDPTVFLISAAKMKTHLQCIVTLSLKNVLMAAPINDYQKNDWKVGDKFNMHVIPEAATNGPIFYNLFQMAHYVYPDLAVIDGFVGMEGNGPTDGTDVDSRLAIASLDALAADTVGATVMGFDPNIIPYLKFLNQGGFGHGNISDIEVVGTPISQCKMKFKPSDSSAKAFNLS
jgi:uncharacterized protein (DUF362 family)